MNDNEKLLKIVKSKIYHGEIKEEEFLNVIQEAKDDIAKDVEFNCEHNFIYQTDGYGYEICSKCGKFKD
jgi:predicted glycoside hydrolase/deacetylase ChbG (UPF0249 family)